MSQNRGKTVRKRVLLLMSVALSWLMLATLTAAGPASAGPAKTARFDAKRYLQTHGYLPLRGVATLERAKANAAAIAAAIQPAANLATAATLRTPTIGAHWPGVATSNVSPPDANGAIGPNSYVEVVNQKMGIYTRAGSKLAGASLTTLTGHSGESDPMVLWDPHTQRFYYNVLNVNNAKMDWGYSKTANPTSIPGSFCSYETTFNYSTSSIPDYPKLGQTKDFLMIGVNFYAGASSSQTTSSDILWVKKPQGTGAVTTCPSATSFGTGKITGLLNEDGTQAFTPTPAIQTDPSSTGYIMSMSDIECPPNCGTGTKLTVFTLTPNGSNPSVPQISAPDSITVGSYTNPANAPQKNSVNTLDTLDGRITHAVSGFDPVANATTVWVAHAVLGGAGAQVRWYEIKPTPLGSGTVVQSGSATSSSLYSFNAGISNDRACTATSCSHGDSMVVGFTTSSSNTFPAIQMVSKAGTNAQSGYVLVRQSGVADSGFTCSPCRWGDYGGATPDPAASATAPHGEVWLTNQWTNGGDIFSSGDKTFNWEAKP